MKKLPGIINNRHNVLMSKENSFRKLLCFQDCILYSQLQMRLVRDQSQRCDTKNWIRCTMIQKRLNHAMLLSIHKENTHNLHFIDITKMFCERNEKQCFVCVFCKEGSQLPLTLSLTLSYIFYKICCKTY